MKISCEVIKDLLPLYHDDVCSNDSKAMIEEHLSLCNNCKSELEMMDEVLPLSIKDQNLKEAEAVQKLSRIWKRGMLKSLFKGILITVIAVLIIYIFMDFRIS